MKLDFFNVWSFIVAIATGLLAMSFPLSLVWSIEQEFIFPTYQWVINAILILDIPINIYHIHSNKSEFLLPEEIRPESYFKKWLAIDFVAAIPFYSLTGSMILSVIRLIKLVKISHHMTMLSRKQIRYNVHLKIMNFVFWMSLLAHWLSCGWMYIHGIDSTIDLKSNYIRALYWVVTTLTTVGYGDITPHTNSEYLYTIMMQILGIGAFGYIIGNVTFYLKRRDPATLSYIENIEKLNTLLKYRGLPKSLQRKLQYFYTYQWRERLGYDESSLLTGLPESLKGEVSIHLKKEIIRKISLFRNAEEGFLDEIAKMLTTVVLTPGDYLFRSGDEGDAMYFVISGELSALDNSEENTFAEFSVGDHFGEIALFEEEARTASIKAQTYCDLYRLDKKVFQRIKNLYIDIYEEVRAKAISRQKDNILARTNR
ncbi:MAG: cyclic nucleotide-binding domain-containing protein [Bacteroidota bacterium]